MVLGNESLAHKAANWATIGLAQKINFLAKTSDKNFDFDDKELAQYDLLSTRYDVQDGNISCRSAVADFC